VNGVVFDLEFQGAQPFAATTVPEPSTLALCTVVLLGLAGATWRRQRRVA
jgi:hypothetical protein